MYSNVTKIMLPAKI